MARPGFVRDMARDLARARHTGVQAHGVGLRRISSLEDAHSVQSQANLAYGRVPRGWTMAGTSRITARLLRLETPVFGALFDEDMLPDGSTYRLPYGMLGIGCGLAFVFGRSFPIDHTDQDVGSAIVQAYVCLQLLGRRAASVEPLNDWTATADFGLDALHVRGAVREDWSGLDLTQAKFSLTLDGRRIGFGRGADIMSDPVAAAVWLAYQRTSRGGAIEAGDVVAVGSCTGLSQVVPGQTVTGICSMLGSVTLRLG